MWAPGVFGQLLSPELPGTGAVATPHCALRGRLSGARLTDARRLDGSVRVAQGGVEGGALEGGLAYGDGAVCVPKGPQGPPGRQREATCLLSSRDPGGEAGGAHSRGPPQPRGGTPLLLSPGWYQALTGDRCMEEVSRWVRGRGKKACKTLPSKNKGLQISLFRNKNTLAMAMRFHGTRQTLASTPTADSMTCLLSFYYLSGVSVQAPVGTFDRTRTRH